jgi:hypothetical protein
LKNAVSGNFFITGNGYGGENLAAFIQSDNFFRIIDIVIGIGIAIGFLYGL